MGVHPMAMIPLKLLFSQQTVCWVQLLPPPTILIEEQEIPTMTVKSWRTMPRRPRRSPATGLEALVIWLQHCTSPLLHELPGAVTVLPGAVTVTVVVTGGGGPPQGAGVAATKSVKDTRAKRKMVEMRENMLRRLVTDCRD